MTPGAIDTLLPARPRFVSFVRSQVGARAVAEDIVQGAFAQALQEPRHLEGVHLTRWFYRTLRNAVVDRHRRGIAEGRALERLQRDPTMPPSADIPRRVCGCVRRALDGLGPKARRVIESVELTGLTPAEFARAEGISPGNAAVRLYRARRLLAEHLKAICGTCTLDGCSDCDCGHRAPSPM